MTAYDRDGNVLTRVDGKGLTTQFSYADPESLLTSISYPAPYNTTNNAAFTYDSYGRTSTVSDATGGRTYHYDDLDGVTAVDTNFANGTGPFTLSYSFNTDGSVAAMTTPAGVTYYSYDQAARLIGLSDASNGSFGFGYYPSDWLSSQSTGTLFNSAYFYDQDGALYSVQNTPPGQPGSPLSTFGFGRNSLGLRTEQDSFYSSQAGYGGTANYGYDTLNRLISETSTANGGFSNGYAYDAAGNPTTFRSGDPTAGAGYNADNQNALGLFHYDGEGNPTTYRGISGQTFDAEDRPLTLATNAGSVANGWRVDGLRGWKNGNSGTVNYLYAGGVPVCEMTGSNVTAVNTWGPNGLLARKTTNPTTGVSASTYYAWDGLGNAAQTLSSSGTVTNTFCYDAYGVRTSTSATTDPYSGFGGQWGYQTEAETGLTLCGARYYDSIAGRWLTRDPAGYGGGINLYGYVGGNPLSFADPSGHGWWGILGGAAVGIGVGLITMNPVAGMWAGFAAGTAIGHWGEHEDWTQAAGTGIGAALMVPDGIALAAPFLPAARAGMSMLGGAIGFSKCFVAGTPVTMADGTTKPIEQVKAGDLVLSRPQEEASPQNQLTNNNVKSTRTTATAKRVMRTFVHEQATLLKLHLESGETITTTPGHPFVVEGEGFVPAGRLAIGNAIVTRAGPAVKIVGIEHPAEKVTVYNFEVEGTHTYFVGKTNGGLWVHNVCNVTHLGSPEEAWEAARVGAGWPENGVPIEMPPSPLTPGSRAPQGAPGFHQQWQCAFEGPDGSFNVHPNTIHLDPFGHFFENGDVIPPHYGVNPNGGSQTIMHYTWPTAHDPRTNR